MLTHRKAHNCSAIFLSGVRCSAVLILSDVTLIKLDHKSMPLCDEVQCGAVQCFEDSETDTRENASPLVSKDTSLLIERVQSG